MEIRTDKAFIEEAARASAAEVIISRLVEDRAECEDVKHFGRKMIDDHTEAGKKLIQLATSKNVIPAQKLDRNHEEIWKSLANLNGEEFDSRYIEAMVNDHEKVVSEFEKETAQGDDEQLKEFANSTLPVLREHLEMARDLAGKHSG